MLKWGFHLCLDVAKCNPFYIRSASRIQDFTKSLVREIDMKAYGEPQIVMFGEGNKKGYTLLQLIETSNITGHFCEQDNGFYLDVFSCKPYNNDTVIKVVKEYFEPTFIKSYYIERDFPTKNECSVFELK